MQYWLRVIFYKLKIGIFSMWLLKNCDTAENKLESALLWKNCAHQSILPK